jgi:hypothetical protein
MTANIDDFRIGDILGQSWDIFRKNFMSFGLTSVVLLALPTILMFAFVMPGLIKGGSLWAAQLPSLFQMVFQLILMGAISYGTYAAIDGQTTTPQDLLARGVAGILPLLGIIAIFILVMIPSVFLLFVPLIFVMCMWWVAVPAAIVEKSGVIGSLKRSADLTIGARMKIFGLIMIYILFSIIVGLVSLLFLTGGGFSMSAITQSSMALMTGGFSLYLLVSQISGALVFAFISVVVAVCYAELRRIKEGVSVKDVAHIFS